MKRALPYILLGLAICVTTLGIGLVTRDLADEGLRLAIADIENDCDDQLSLILHVNAVDLAERFANTNHATHAELKGIFDYYKIDEFTLVGSDGRILLTTDPFAKVGERFFVDDSRQHPYHDLRTGLRTTVRQRFRPSVTNDRRIMKYFAMALPQGRFLQIGFLWESFEDFFPRFFLPIFETRLVSETGYCVVLDEHGTIEVNVPGHPEAKGRPAAEIGFTSEDLAVPMGEIFRPRLFGERCRCMSYPECIAGRRIYAVIPIAEERDPALILACGVALVLIAAFIVFRLVLRKFRLQQARIDALRAEEERHRVADMALAHAIQQAELRTDGTEGDNYRIATLMHAAREVGGDFYDYYELPDGRLVVTIADVSGKGVPAAFFMMKARMTLKSCVYSSKTLAEAVAKANVRLAKNNPAEMFVTAWVGVYDRQTGVLDCVSAGHNAPLIRRQSSGVEWLQCPRCAALGVFENAKYRGAQTSLGPGERLFLYTDGVTEAMNRSGELFGDERLRAVLNGAPDDGVASKDILPAVEDAVRAFVAGAEQSDDITMLELEIKL